MTQQLLGWVADIEGWVGSLLYGLFAIIFRLMDWLQGIFRSLAGLEAISINGEIINSSSSEAKYDIVYYLIGTDIVIDVFISMFAFSTVLLIIMTVISLFRNSYVDKPKPVMEIIGKSFKGLLGFLLVPIACIAGLMFGNVLLELVDSATGGGNTSNMSGNLFISCAYDANVLRQDELSDCETALLNLLKETNFEEYSGVSKYLPNNSDNNWTKADMGNVSREEFDILADLLDDAYTSGSLKRTSDGVTLDIYKCGMVKQAYKPISINYLIMVVGGCLLLGILFKMCWGLIGRIFKIVIDFVMIPVVLAMMPFDENPVGSWKKDFIKNVTLSYATIGVLNIYYSILPVINNISFSNNAWISNGFFNDIFKLMLQIIGIFSADGIIKTVSGWFGGGDLIGEGASTWKTLKDGTKTIQTKATGTGKKVIGAFGGFVGGVKKADSNWSKPLRGVQGALSAAGLTKGMDEINLKKYWADGLKAGGDYAETQASSHWSDNLSNSGKVKKLSKDFNKKYADIKVLDENGNEDVKATEAAKKEALIDSEIGKALVEQNGEISFLGENRKIQDVDRQISATEKVLEKVNGRRDATKAGMSSYDKLVSAENLLSDLRTSGASQAEIAKQKALVEDLKSEKEESYISMFASLQGSDIGGSKKLFEDVLNAAGVEVANISSKEDVLNLEESKLKTIYAELKSRQNDVKKVSEDIDKAQREQSAKLERMKSERKSGLVEAIKEVTEIEDKNIDASRKKSNTQAVGKGVGKSK